jgi:nitroimidazol reductase NimA-like FMN-containing flavoprotein (pyridoxamine 5'-phosphate oxidase superfamily)
MNTKPGRKRLPRQNEPIAGRPAMRGYGIPRHKKGLLPWSHVIERLANARHYWICTVSPEGRPHSTPVDGLWLDAQLYFGGSPTTRRHRNLAANPAVCVHLDGATDVVILHGEARELHAPDRDLATRLAEGSAEKYGYGFNPEDYERLEGIWIFRPRTVLAWKRFPQDATKWRLP